ncbi:hypothetical protein ABZX93_33575 [Streptomyces sp. NPDC006632]|uniref:hypothetical protein n=1 Tax=Streptomyces sp. NPDC006632 TaxID=3157182 RepID=UPI0033AF22BB
MPNGAEGTFEEVRRLLEAEAERRGVSGTELLDQLAREGRSTGLADTEGQDDLTAWVTPLIERGGEEKTVTVLDGAEGAVIVGAMGRGKTNTADLTRAQLDAAGLPYEETVTEDGRIKFTVDPPQDDAT